MTISLRLSALFAMLLLAMPALAQPLPQPLQIKPGEKHTFPADQRLNILTGGTIEFWVAASGNTTAPQCLISHGEGEELAYRIHIGQNRKTVQFEIPDLGTFFVAADLSDGAYHHVAFTMSQGKLFALIDGEVPLTPGDAPGELFELGPVFMAPGNGGAAGAALILGCEGAAPFSGHLLSFRLWRTALSPFEIESVKAFTAVPEERFGNGVNEFMLRDLVAYGIFDSAGPRLFYTEPALERHAAPHLVEAGTSALVHSDRLDGALGEEVSRIYVRTGFRGIEGLAFEFLSDGGVPQILPRASDWGWIDDTRLAELQEQAQDAFAVNDRDFAEAQIEARRLQIGFDPVADPLVWESTDWQILDLAPGQRITGVAGRHDSARITSLRFFTNQGPLPLITSPGRSSEIFAVRLPEQTKFAGAELFLGEDRRDSRSRRHFGLRALHSISLIGRPEPLPEDLAPLANLTRTLWQHRGECPPRINDELAYQRNHNRPVTEAAGPHGIYTTPAVTRLRLDVEARQLVALTERHQVFEENDRGFNTCGIAQLGDRELLTRRFRVDPNSGANVLPGTAGTFDLLRLVEGGQALNVVTPDGAPGGPLVPVLPPPRASVDRLAWGGTFSLPHRPSNVRANFIGYDITQLDPHNFLRSHGLKKPVFVYPSDDSTDYLTTDNNLIVPRGVHFRSDLAGSEQQHTIMVGGSAEYQRAWSVSLGFNMGFGLDGIGGAFSANATYGERLSNRQDREVVTSITRTAETRYALIMDRARMQLDPAFREAILRQRDRLLLDERPNFQEFVFAYGTHYPYAVTYGGMAFLEIDYSKLVVDHMRGSSISFEEQASLSFSSQSGQDGCGCSGGSSPFSADIGASGGFTDDRQLATEARQSDESHRFGIYGGSLSRGEGWSLSPGQEVPLFYDMRPLDELLSPIFFDDPLVWERLAPILNDQIRAHLQGAARAQGRPDTVSWLVDAGARTELDTYESDVWDHPYKVED